jgi:hypothetical protein
MRGYRDTAPITAPQRYSSADLWLSVSSSTTQRDGTYTLLGVKLVSPGAAKAYAAMPSDTPLVNA